MAIMAINAEQCQLLVNYVTADLIDKANVCTERSEIESLRSEAESMGLQIDFEWIWKETQKEAIQYHLDSRWFQLFGI